MLNIAYHKLYNHPVPDNHKFPMEKYDLLPQQLIHEGIASEKDFFTPCKIEEKHVVNTHDENYFKKLTQLQLSHKEQRTSGFIHNKQLIQRELIIMEGTRLAAQKAIKGKIGFNIAGGTHHAYSNKGEGFCLLNDQAIASNFLLAEKLASKVLIIDLDVHQGNGTAEIFAKNSNVFTFSMHGATNYPFKKETSDLDIPLENGTTDKTYLKLLDYHLNETVDKFHPDFIFYQSGVDVLETDKLGKLSLSIKGCKERDRLVLQKAKEANIPIVCSMGGGYSQEIKYIIEAHTNLYRLAQEIYF